MDAVLGIDIAKAKFNVTLLCPDGTRRRKACANSAAGCAELLAWLTRHGAGRVHACLEATGTYGERLATTLVEAGIRSVSSIRRSSTTTRKANWCARKPIVWTRMSSLTMRRKSTRPRGRPCRGTCANSRPWCAGSTRCWGCRPTNATARRPAGSPPPCSSRSTRSWRTSRSRSTWSVNRSARIWISIQAARPARSADQHSGDRRGDGGLLLAELFNKPFASARQAAAFAGVVPRPNDSGMHQGRRVMCKLGPGRLRKGLYFPAIAAIRFNPSLQPLAHRLRGAGKPPMLSSVRRCQTHSPGIRRAQIRSRLRCETRQRLTRNTVYFSCGFWAGMQRDIGCRPGEDVRQAIVTNLHAE